MNLPTYVTGTVQTQAYGILREQVYAVLSQYNLTPSYWSMLGFITQAKNGLRQAEIAAMMRVKAPLITVMARELESKGLIKSVQNQFDARAKLLALTPEGKKTVKTIEVHLAKSLDELLVGLTESDLSTYHKVLATIVSNKTAKQ